MKIQRSKLQVYQLVLGLTLTNCLDCVTGFFEPVPSAYDVRLI